MSDVKLVFKTGFQGGCFFFIIYFTKSKMLLCYFATFYIFIKHVPLLYVIICLFLKAE